MTSTIADYAIIGDGQSCALVSKTGSIDFLCWPHFDSDACLLALLGNERHGHWRIAPVVDVSSAIRQYRKDTGILETEYVIDSGRVRVTDFMPWQDGPSSIIRVVEGLEGTVPMDLSLRLQFGYGQIAPWWQRHESGLVFEAGPHLVLVDSPVTLILNAGDFRGSFTISKGQRTVFTMSYSPSTHPLPPPLIADTLISLTEQQWRTWIGQLEPKGRWDAAVRRSLITLRILTDRQTGGIIAAATFGLPEIPGGSANWDYRYCWLRDSTFTLTALLNAGFHEEAKRWRDWILRSIAGQPETMRIVYRINGAPRLHEYELPGLPGYQGAKPILVGNAASAQTQLDVFGELMDSFDVLAKAGIERTQRVIEVEIAIVKHLEKVWSQPSADIWESRGDLHCYTYSQVMTWVGINRFLAAHAGDNKIDAKMTGRLKMLESEIHQTICKRGYRSDLGHFVQHYDSDVLDGSLLLLPLVGFLPVDDPRIVGTIAAIERDLMEDGLVRRKPRFADGPDEGVFLACSCWLADCYKMQGRDSKASEMLERVIGVSNDLGILTEEYDVRSRTLVGNVPQALSHLGVINSALYLSGPVIQRAGG